MAQKRFSRGPQEIEDETVNDMFMQAQLRARREQRQPKPCVDVDSAVTELESSTLSQEV